MDKMFTYHITHIPALKLQLNIYIYIYIIHQIVFWHPTLFVLILVFSYPNVLIIITNNYQISTYSNNKVTHYSLDVQLSLPTYRNNLPPTETGSTMDVSTGRDATGP